MVEGFNELVIFRVVGIKQRLGRVVSVNKVEQHYSGLLELEPFSVSLFHPLNGGTNNMLATVSPV